MRVLTLLSKIIDDASTTLSQFECWEDDDKVCYLSSSITEEVMDILDVDGISGDCMVAFKADENNYFVIDTISYVDECGNEIPYEVAKTINEYIDSQDWEDVYHRLCEEAVNLAIL